MIPGLDAGPRNAKPSLLTSKFFSSFFPAHINLVQCCDCTDVNHDQYKPELAPSLAPQDDFKREAVEDREIGKRMKEMDRE